MSVKCKMLPSLEFVMVTAAEYSVFPWHCFSFKSARVISLFGVQLSGLIHFSHVKTAIFDIVF